MGGIDILKRLWANLSALGPRRLIALGITGITVFALVGVSSYFLSQPRQEVLYANLQPQDVTQMGAALEDAGIGFDVNVAGDSVLVEYGQAAKARMLLAQKGLPRSDSAGYELFDKLGSLGLTTFMQQVTKVRALEGELARTIQLIDGVKAARVHLALRTEGSFRNAGEQATASVIIRADAEAGARAATAIRHLVAASIPGLAAGHVTVMSADGTVLSSTDDPNFAAPEKLIGLERSLSADIEAKIARTIVPYLGLGNFRVSVTAKLNADRRQINETNFDPNSRVERSVRTIKESGEAQNATGNAAVTVEQNIPVEEAPKGNGDNSSERKDRKEELTNYEINSRSVSTVSEGYGIDRLSVAVVVNRGVVAAQLGNNPSEDAVNAKIQEIRDLVTSAAGLVEDRGDRVSVVAASFVDEAAAAPEVEGEGIMEFLTGHLGSFLNAGALVLVTLLVLLLGLRPALRTILGDRPASASGEFDALGGPGGIGQLPGAEGNPLDGMTLPPFGGVQAADDGLDDLVRGAASNPKDRLAKIVELDPDRAVEVLKAWLREPAGQGS